jgi:hypothetical protein
MQLHEQLKSTFMNCRPRTKHGFEAMPGNGVSSPKLEDASSGNFYIARSVLTLFRAEELFSFS